MNFKHLKTFIEVANGQSFSNAAARLHTVQSAISRHINALEEELGVSLFERNTRHVALTRSGEVYLTHAKAIVAHCEQAKHDAQLVAQGKQGVLRIGYLSSACAHFLPSMLRRFNEFASNIDVQIFEMTAAEQLTAFIDGSIDIGFSRPVDYGYEGLIKHKHLSDDPIYLVVNDTHFLAEKGEAGLSDLIPYPLTLFAREQAIGLFDTLISVFHQHDIRPKVHSEPASMQALLTQVASSQSVALVPGCVRNLQTQQCRFIPLNIKIFVPLEMHWENSPTATAQTWLHWCEQHVNLERETATPCSSA
ncbi:LysR family transcriptional regulator [Marinomonas ushuaiensis DSM 15871]|uniref:LysR family transcriptional regulator n=1 Tax=Marinomonas ushuaiensis DSM 15871 TaxID=1122207 RepID=X7E8J7_9GAMM|nr:LysR family transcriptional regulator [Marinomonas ushuaiensis]ETX12374.1 LysR family transcriptional regulator [Marinomonas ushuaiensis DSM 15871]